MSEQPDGTRGGSGRGRGHGAVEEEAHRLVRAAADWWHACEDQAAAGERAATGGPAETRAPGHDGAAPCTGCPWCRAKTAVGPAGADALLGLADLLGSAADSLRAYARSQGAGDPQGQPGGPGPEEDAEARRGQPRGEEP